MALESLDPAAVTGGSALLVGLAWYARQFFLAWMKSRPEVSAASAIDQQIKMLQEQMTDIKIENKELRLQFHAMDLKLHRQQTKLTRTEVLLRQFVGLVKENGVNVPDFMQSELDGLLAGDRDSEPPALPEEP